MISREVYDLLFLRGWSCPKYFYSGGEKRAVSLIREYSIYHYRDMTFLKVYFTPFEKKESNKFPRNVLLERSKITVLGVWFCESGHRECRRKRRLYFFTIGLFFTISIDKTIRNKLVGQLRFINDLKNLSPNATIHII